MPSSGGNTPENHSPATMPTNSTNTTSNTSFFLPPPAGLSPACASIGFAVAALLMLSPHPVNRRAGMRAPP